MPEQLNRSLKAVASDIAEGFIAVNPIFLKPFNETTLKALYAALERKQTEIRTEPFPYNNPLLIRKRNVRLQRLYSATVVIRNFARERKFALFQGKS